MKVTVSRVKMAGCGGKAFSYDVYVRKTDCPRWQRESDCHGNSHTTICRDGGEFYDYTDATESREHRAMEQGWARLADFEQHAKKAAAEKLTLAKRAFPELTFLDKWPLLWCFPPNMPPDASHLDIEIEA